MEATVDKLEAMFQKTESDLDYVSRKLDAEFANRDDFQGKNPAKLIEKVGEIKQEFAEIVKEAQEIQDAQKDAMGFFQNQLMTMCSALAKLQTSTATQGEKPEELVKLEEMLGIDSSASSRLWEDGTSEQPREGMSTPPRQRVVEEEEEQCEGATAAAVPAPAVLSPYSRRQDQEEVVEIDEEEFTSVSSLTRGRVKIGDVNQTYRILWNHFKEEGNSDYLTPSDMYKMGLRVTGQTGEAKLKVLRSLKLLDMDRKGNVKLL